jgi:hypothetical protein
METRAEPRAVRLRLSSGEVVKAMQNRDARSVYTVAAFLAPRPGDVVSLLVGEGADEWWWTRTVEVVERAGDYANLRLCTAPVAPDVERGMSAARVGPEAARDDGVFSVAEEQGDGGLPEGVVRSNLWAFEGMRRPITPGRAILWLVESLLTRKAQAKLAKRREEDAELMVWALMNEWTVHPAPGGWEWRTTEHHAPAYGPMLEYASPASPSSPDIPTLTPELRERLQVERDARRKEAT